MCADRPMDDHAGIAQLRGNSAEIPGDMRADELWAVLIAQPGVGVIFVDEEGVVDFANEQVQGLWSHTSRDELIGKRLEEIFPSIVAHERRAHVRRALERHETVVERVMWGGVRVQSIYRGVGGGAGVLILSMRAAHTEPPAGHIAAPSFADFGPLDTLSPREIEVLAYVGKGMRIKEIAQSMERSPKTVQNHRESIGHKLRVTDRVSLAHIAREAGLEPSDAGLVRIRNKG